MLKHDSDYLPYLRLQGYRITLQRLMILKIIGEQGGHITPEAIYQQVQVQAPAVNRATVYRALDFLCDRRLVVAAHIGRNTVYELAGEEPHHHLVCRQCDAIRTLKHASIKAFFRKLNREEKFIVDMDHLTIFGICPNCQSAEARKKTR